MAGDRFRRVHSRHKPLSGCFFIAAGAVDLTGREEIVVTFDPERALQLVRVEKVIFNRIGITGNHCVFQSRHGTDHLPLYLGRKTGGDSINIKLVCLGSFRLQIEQMARMLREANDLILKRGAVTSTDSFDNSLIHGRIL